MKYIEALEVSFGKQAEKEYFPLQPGDVPDTYADVSDLVNDFNFKPETSLEKGINNFVDWYKEFYKS